MRKGLKIKSSESYLDTIQRRIKHKVKVEKGIDELTTNVEYHRLLLEITRSINTPMEFNQLLGLIVDSAMSLSKAERGFLVLFDKNNNLEFKVTRNISNRTLESDRFRISRSVVNQVLATGKSIFLSDIYKDKGFKVSESIEALALRMVMCVPLKAKESVLGVIYVDSHSITESFGQLEERIFEAFAAQASVAIENSYLYDQSVRDSLTGLYNSAYLRMRLEEEIMRGLDYKKGTISLIMFDLDRFKIINDSYGHLFGNSILIKVADVIRATVRRYDVPVRYGGDEFAILLPDTEVNEASHLAQRLNKAIADLKFTSGGQGISITASIGISVFPVDQVGDHEKIIIEADHALYIAKGKGGNQITVFGLRKEEKPGRFEIIGRARTIDEVRKTIAKVARTDATVLISGETGTGKELVANLIHCQSRRSDKPLVVVNCGAIPDNLLESELFGHEKGAFTGAYAQRKGKFELAQGGTVFLDEIGELPIHLQVKILRGLEQKEIDRIGSRAPIKVDIRVVAASNKDLEEEVKQGRFRKDLFYRLSVATIYLPPLRARPDDIELLSRYYLEVMNKRYRRRFLGFTNDAIEAMCSHLWPGNVRELIHRIERAVITSNQDYLDSYSLGLITQRISKISTLRESTDKTERECIIRALIHNRWNITYSARELGISRQTLRYLIKKHKIQKDVQPMTSTPDQ